MVVATHLTVNKPMTEISPLHEIFVNVATEEYFCNIW